MTTMTTMPLGQLQARVLEHSRHLNEDADARPLELQSVDMSDAWLMNYTLSGAEFRSCKLAGGRFPMCDFQSARFVGCDLSDADLSEDCLDSAVFVNCNLSGARLNLSSLRCARFYDCDLSDADLSESLFRRAIFSRCDFTGASFREASFELAEISDCIFHANDIVRAVGDGEVIRSLKIGGIAVVVIAGSDQIALDDARIPLSAWQAENDDQVSTRIIDAISPNYEPIDVATFAKYRNLWLRHRKLISDLATIR